MRFLDPSCARVAAASVVLACLPLAPPAIASPVGPAPAASRKIVVMASGSRLEVDRAWQVGERWHLELRGGATIIVPAASVRRISSSAADAPSRIGPAQATGSKPGAAPASAPQAVVATNASAAQEATAAPGGSMPEVVVRPSPTSATGSPRPAAGRGPFAGLTPAPGVMSRILTRVGPGAGVARSIDAPRRPR